MKKLNPQFVRHRITNQYVLSVYVWMYRREGAERPWPSTGGTRAQGI